MHEKINSKSEQGIDYEQIFREEQEKLQLAYPGSNFAPGSREAQELHRNANERVVMGALREAFTARGLDASDDTLERLARLYAMTITPLWFV